MTKPTIVIIPGAWQKPVAFEGISQKLQEAGYNTVVVPLRTVGGTETPLAGLEDDVAAVQQALAKLAQESKKALILPHSAGGLVASNAVAGQHNVYGIIYMTAWMIPAGKSILDMFGGTAPPPWMKVEGDRVSISDEAGSGADVGLNDMDAEAQEKWGKEMTHTSVKLLATPSGYEPWKKGVPCAYIFMSEDNAIPLALQQEMASQLPGPEPLTVTLKGGHCPHLSMPDQLVETVKTLEARLR